MSLYESKQARLDHEAARKARQFTVPPEQHRTEPERVPNTGRLSTGGVLAAPTSLTVRQRAEAALETQNAEPIVRPPTAQAGVCGDMSFNVRVRDHKILQELSDARKPASEKPTEKTPGEIEHEQIMKWRSQGSMSDGFKF